MKGAGVVDGEGGNSESCLKWGGVIKGSFQNHLKIGVGKGKVVRRGEGVQRVSPPLPFPLKF